MATTVFNKPIDDEIPTARLLTENVDYTLTKAALATNAGTLDYTIYKVSKNVYSLYFKFKNGEGSAIAKNSMNTFFTINLTNGATPIGGSYIPCRAIDNSNNEKYINARMATSTSFTGIRLYIINPSTTGWTGQDITVYGRVFFFTDE